ncbi:MAG: zinc ribbon domain-containing protein [Chloroflexi bacterium]|nr:zinc ribbon domain-containing protein [Chloroflexota bacterium]
MGVRYCTVCGGLLVTRRSVADERERQVCTACGRVH